MFRATYLFFRWLFIGLFSLILLSIAILWGFQQSFPGASLSEYAQKFLASHAQIRTEILPLQLEWNQLKSDSISILRPATLADIPIDKLITFEEVSVPFAPLILSQQAQLHANAYNGTILVSSPLLSRNQLAVQSNGIQIGRIPAANILPFGFPSGIFNVDGKFTNLQELQARKTQIPTGWFRGSIQQFRFRFNTDYTLFAGMKIPDFLLSSIDFNIQLDKEQIQLKDLRLSGNLAGTVVGTVWVNSQNIQDSRIDFNVQIEPDQALLKSLGVFKMILQPYQCGNAINIRIQGNFRSIHPPQRNPC